MLEKGHIEERLLDFLYGELSEPETKKVELHLADCRDCAAEVEKLQGVRTAMADLPRLSPSASTVAVIRRRAQELAPKPQRAGFLSFLLRPSFAGAFLFVVILGVGLYLARDTSPSGPVADTPEVGRFSAATATPAPASAPDSKVAASPQREESALKEAKAKKAFAEPTTERNSEDPAPNQAAADKSSRRPRFARRLKRRARRGLNAQRGDRRIIAQVKRPARESLFPPKAVATRARRSTSKGGGLGYGYGSTLPPGGYRFRGMDGTIGGAQKGAPGTAGLALGNKADRSNDKDNNFDLSKNQKVAEKATETLKAPAPEPAKPAKTYAQRPIRLEEMPAASAAVPSEPAPREQQQTNLPKSSLDGMLALQQQMQPRRIAPPPPPAPTGKLQTSAPKRGPAKDVHIRDSEVSDEQRLENRATAHGAPAAKALIALAKLQLRRGKVREAIATLERLLRTNRKHASKSAYDLLASAYERQGDGRGARDARARALRHFGRSTPTTAASESASVPSKAKKQSAY